MVETAVSVAISTYTQAKTMSSFQKDESGSNLGSTVKENDEFFPSVVGTLIYDGRFGDGETVKYSRRIYCRNEYNSIQYCSITVANNAGSCISSSSPLECSYNRLGLRCYSMLIEIRKQCVVFNNNAKTVLHEACQVNI